MAVQAVADADAALAAIADPDRPAPGLVLTDVMLPGRSGLQVTAELRKSPRTARLPIIMLTARGGSDAAAEWLAAGADDYITKPFSSQELLARVRANHELHELRETAVDEAEDRAASIRTALDSNRAIGTAIGIVMAGHRLTATQGFQLLALAGASQHSNRTLREIAAEVVDSGKLPLRPTVTDVLVMRVTSG
ncbi:MAG TPA: response regulator [Nakamurella sp.]|nr:response regulator [Nakamurella sp.]